MHVCHSLRPLDPFLPSGGEGRREGERGEGKGRGEGERGKGRGERGEAGGEWEGERGDGRGIREIGLQVSVHIRILKKTIIA